MKKTCTKCNIEQEDSEFYNKGFIMSKISRQYSRPIRVWRHEDGSVAMWMWEEAYKEQEEEIRKYHSERRSILKDPTIFVLEEEARKIESKIWYKDNDK